MATNWRKFEDYLKKNVIFQTTSNNQNSKAAEHIILDEAKNKYPLENYSELIKVLTNLLCSTKATHTNTFSKCHSLPELTYLSQEQKTVLKKWDELFPKRTETKFGNKEDDASDTEISSETWEVLKKIYGDWSQTILYPSTMDKEADDIIILVLETASKEKYSRIVKKHPGLKKRMEKWLADYEKLTSSQKDALKNEKKKIQGDYEIITSLDDDRNYSQNQTFWGKVKDFKNWPWGTIGISAAIAILVLSFYLMMRKLLKFGN